MRARRSVEPAGPTHHPWAVLPREELLDVRFCDLDLSLEGTWLEACIDRVLEDLDRRAIRLRPHFWLSDEWFCPHGIPGIAFPFYLAHPRLMRLEHTEMGTVEGGTRRECLRLLRHEVGHAVLYAYGLHRRRRFQELFGRSTKPYPDAYRPDPTDRRYVQHLDHWYAQAHPLEDFAETFAVWLDPRSAWRRRYRTWPALEKLEYLNELMSEIAGLRPPRVDRTRIDEVRTDRRTLREHYARRHDRYGGGFPSHFDEELRRLFPAGSATADGVRASTFLVRQRLRLRRRVLVALPDEAYAIDLVLRELTGRARELELRVRPSPQLGEDCALVVTACTVRRLHQIREWYAM